MKVLCLVILSALSIVCFSLECIEIGFDVNVSFSDHLHNIIDHLMYVVINYIGIKIGEKKL